MGLMACIAAGVAQLAAAAERTRGAATRRTAATYAAVAALDALRAAPWLPASPPGTLDVNTPPFVDHVDDGGMAIGAGSAPPEGAVFTRRWALVPLAADPADTLVLQVRVLPAQGGEAVVELVGVRTRRAERP